MFDSQMQELLQQVAEFFGYQSWDATPTEGGNRVANFNFCRASVIETLVEDLPHPGKINIGDEQLCLVTVYQSETHNSCVIAKSNCEEVKAICGATLYKKINNKLNAYLYEEGHHKEDGPYSNLYQF